MRPELNRTMKAETFLKYYWLKQELTSFCQETGLPRMGSKQVLSERIAQFLRNGEVLKADQTSKGGQKMKTLPLSLEALVSPNYRNDEMHRAFFKSIIGDHFKFNVPFMEWMKSNSGKTYQEAVDEWQRIDGLKKAGKKYEISAQFEYNQYTRDFFAANPTLKREDAIACWKFKKALAGSNKYEVGDLRIL